MLTALVAATALMVLMPATGHAQGSTRTACPGTFQVLHNDSIGALRLSAGAYRITVANPARLSCAMAARTWPSSSRTTTASYGSHGA